MLVPLAPPVKAAIRAVPGEEKLSNRFLVGVEGDPTPADGGGEQADLRFESGGVVPDRDAEVRATCDWCARCWKEVGPAPGGRP